MQFSERNFKLNYLSNFINFLENCNNDIENSKEESYKYIKNVINTINDIQYFELLDKEQYKEILNTYTFKKQEFNNKIKVTEDLKTRINELNKGYNQKNNQLKEKIISFINELHHSDEVIENKKASIKLTNFYYEKDNYSELHIALFLKFLFKEVKAENFNSILANYRYKLPALNEDVKHIYTSLNNIKEYIDWKNNPLNKWNYNFIDFIYKFKEISFEISDLFEEINKECLREFTDKTKMYNIYNKELKKLQNYAQDELYFFKKSYTLDMKNLNLLELKKLCIKYDFNYEKLILNIKQYYKNDDMISFNNKSFGLADYIKEINNTEKINEHVYSFLEIIFLYLHQDNIIDIDFKSVNNYLTVFLGKSQTAYLIKLDADKNKTILNKLKNKENNTIENF